MALHAIDNARFTSARASADEQAKLLRGRLGIGKEVVLLFVGKFVDVKRPLDILAAYARLPSELIAASRIVFVGDGYLSDQILAHVKKLSLDGVHVLPFQNQSMLPVIYSMGDVLVLPSESETWGLVVNEAMNLGCPAIVSDRVGCAHDLVVPGQTGWVFARGNLEALSRCFAEAIADPVRLHQMGENARQHVAHFSYDGLTESLQSALRKVCGPKFSA